MQHRIGGLAGVVLLLATSAARADQPVAPPSATVAPPPPQQADDATRARARSIAEEGLELFDAGHHAEALDRFERAGALVKAPTMALMAARSLVKLGRFVEASERYLTASTMKLADDASDAFRAAQADAAKERAALLPRIPTLTIALDGSPDGAAVTLDGKPLSAALIGSAVQLDPGAHTLVVSRAGATKEERVQLHEGESRRLVLSIPSPPATSSPLRTAGWIGLAAGGAGLVAGAIAGGVLVSTKSRLDGAGCQDAKCPPATSGDVDTYNALRPVTTGTLAAGSALAIAGGLLLIFTRPSAGPATTGGSSDSPSRAARRTPTIQPFLGLGSAGVRGVF